MPVPGSQVVGLRPLLDHEERLYCEKPELEAVEKKWSPAARAFSELTESFGISTGLNF